MCRSAVAGIRIMLFFMKIYDVELSCESLRTTWQQVLDTQIELCLDKIRNPCPLLFELTFCDNRKIIEHSDSPPTGRPFACVTKNITTHTSARYTLSNVTVNTNGCGAHVSRVTVQEGNVKYIFTCAKPMCKRSTVYFVGVRNAASCVDQQYFGAFCTKPCECGRNERCSRTGMCQRLECKPGWFGRNCDIKCVSGSFGPDCTKKCHCKDNRPCNHITGKCLNGCAVTYGGENCQKRITDTSATTVKKRKPTFSTTSTKRVTTTRTKSPTTAKRKKQLVSTISPTRSTIDTATTKKSPTTVKRKKQLVTTTSPTRSTPDMESTCKRTMWGVNCDRKCHCKDGVNCNKIYGTCPGNECSARYTGDTCQQTCPDDKYFNTDQTVCDNACGCKIPSSCVVTNGTCVSGGCKEGYIGKNCSIDLKPDASKKTAKKFNPTGIIACLLTMAILICVIVGVYMVKKSKVCNSKNISSKNKDGRNRSDSLISSDSKFIDLAGKAQEWSYAISLPKRKKKSKHKSKTRKKKRKKKKTSCDSSSTYPVSTVTTVSRSVKSDGENSISRSLSFNEKVELKHYNKP